MFVDHFKFVQSVKTLNMTVTVKNDKENSQGRQTRQNSGGGCRFDKGAVTKFF